MHESKKYGVKTLVLRRNEIAGFKKWEEKTTNVREALNMDQKKKKHEGG